MIHSFNDYRKFSKKHNLVINWLPYIIDIPKYLGSAKVDSKNKTIELKVSSP